MRNGGMFEQSAIRIIFQLPFAIAGAGVARIRVTRGGVLSNEVTIRVLPNLPALFSMAGDGLGPAVGGQSDGSAVTTDNPAKPGELISLWATGLGIVAPAVVDGAAAASPTTMPVTV